MKIDQKQLDRLLKLNDDQLRRVLSGLLSEYGIDPDTVPLSKFDMNALRAVLQTATEEDIQRMLSSLSGQGGQGPGR